MKKREKPTVALPNIDHRFKTRGHEWRVQSDGLRGRFDEIVVVTGKKPAKGGKTNGLMLHAEMCDNRSMFVDVAGLCLWVYVGRNGAARITYAEDRRNFPNVVVSPALRDPACDKPGYK